MRTVPKNIEIINLAKVALAVVARSAADTPVDVPGRKSSKRGRLVNAALLSRLSPKSTLWQIDADCMMDSYSYGLGCHRRNVEIGGICIRVRCSRLSTSKDVLWIIVGTGF